MSIYRVTGELDYTTYCDCPYCEGHTKRKKIAELVEATSAKAAMIHVAIGSDVSDVNDWEDLDDYLTAVEAPPDQAMTALRMPTLFDLEPTP